MNPIHALSSYSLKILVSIILPPKNADKLIITAWVTHICCHAETTISVHYQAFPTFPSLYLLHQLFCVAQIMFMAFSSVNIWKVFLAKSCPHGSVALRNISVHVLATTQCCQPKHRASCILYRIHLNNVTGVTTWGTLTVFQTCAPVPSHSQSAKSQVEYSLFCKNCDTSFQCLLVICNEKFSLPVLQPHSCPCLPVILSLCACCGIITY